MPDEDKYGPPPQIVVGEQAAPKLPPYLGGVPEGYSVPSQTGPIQQVMLGGQVIEGPGMAQRQPIYRQGDQALILGAMSPEQVAFIKQTMVDAGLLSAGALKSGGFVDTPTRSAFEEVLVAANLNAGTWEDALAGLKAQVEVGGTTTGASGAASAPARAPLTTQVSNTQDLVMLADRVARQVLGRKLDRQTAENIAYSVQAAERAAQAQAYELEGQGEGGEIMAPQSPSDMAQGIIRDKFGAEAEAGDLAGTFNQFMSIIKGEF